MASFTKVSSKKETSNGRSHSGNSHLNLLISHSEVGSSYNHTPMPTHLGQLGQSRRLSEASNMTVTPSRRVHIHTIINLNPIVVPNYQPPTTAGLGYNCSLHGDHHHHYHRSSFVTDHEVFRTPEVARAQLLSATLSTTRRFSDSGHHVQAIQNAINSLIPPQYLHHHPVSFTTTSTNVPSTSRSAERVEASRRFVLLSHRDQNTNEDNDVVQLSEPIPAERLRVYLKAASQSEQPVKDATHQPNKRAVALLTREKKGRLILNLSLSLLELMAVCETGGSTTYVSTMKRVRAQSAAEFSRHHNSLMHMPRLCTTGKRARRRGEKAGGESPRRTNSNNLWLVVLDDNTITILPHDHEHFRGENSGQAAARLSVF